MTVKGMYSKTHSAIKDNNQLLSELKKLLSDEGILNSKKYVRTGLKINDIYLGLDFIPDHVKSFNKIIANTLLIENCSNEQADFSRVLLQVYLDGKHVANLTEDVSQNGAYEIYDEGILWGPYTDYLQNFFGVDSARAVFAVYEKPKPVFDRDRTKLPPPRFIRTPIIDLDHFQFNGQNFYPSDLYKEEIFVLNLETNVLV